MIEDTTEALLDKHLGVKCKGTYLCSMNVGRHLIEQKRGGKIINITSPAGFSVQPGQLPYSAANAAMRQMTKQFAVEWGKYNINVNSVCPGSTLTPHHEMLERESPGRYDGQLKRVPLKRFVTPEDVAKAVLFLASSDADSITGIEVVVDCGPTALWGGHAFREEK